MTRTRVAVVGCGHLGAIHARLLAARPDAELVAVVDPDAAARERTAATLGCRAVAEPVGLAGLVDAAVVVHRDLGSGLLESVYEAVLADELTRRGLAVTRQVPVPITCRGLRFDEGFRADLIVEGKVIIELKSVQQLHDAHKKQLLTYLRLSGLKLGFLLNFGAPLIRDGLVRVVNGLEET